VNPKVFLLLNVALAFYLVGAIWAMEVDIFRSWKLVGATDFPTVQAVHWRKLPYWVFARRWGWRSSIPLSSSGITLPSRLLGLDGGTWHANSRLIW